MSAYRSIDPERIRAFIKREGITVRVPRRTHLWDSIYSVLLDHPGDAVSVASELGTTKEAATAALSNLKRMGLVTVIEDGQQGVAGSRAVYAPSHGIEIIALERPKKRHIKRNGKKT